MNIGKEGQDLAEEFLKRRGYEFVERNFRTPRWGEIDLIMRDGDTTVFVEVKTRSSGSQLFGGPLGAINYHKLKALQRAAQYYLTSQGFNWEAVRIDAVTVILRPDGTSKINHYSDITSGMIK